MLNQPLNYPVSCFQMRLRSSHELSMTRRRDQCHRKLQTINAICSGKSLALLAPLVRLVEWQHPCRGVESCCQQEFRRLTTLLHAAVVVELLHPEGDSPWSSQRDSDALVVESPLQTKWKFAFSATSGQNWHWSRNTGLINTVEKLEKEQLNNTRVEVKKSWINK